MHMCMTIKINERVYLKRVVGSATFVKLLYQFTLVTLRRVLFDNPWSPSAALVRLDLTQT